MKGKPISVIILVLFMCALLFFAGVLSGLYANKLTEENTKESLSIFKQETQEDLESFKTSQEETLANYIRFLETNMNSIQVQQDFLSTVNKEDRCEFSDVSLQHMTKQLQFYRDRLPYRLEEYERDNQLSDEYLQLKEQYNTLSIRMWVFVRELAEECESNLVHGLYFYSTDCDTCVSQGEELDRFTNRLATEGTDVLLFTIDAQSDEPMVEFLRSFYGISMLPTIVINDKTFVGFVKADRLEVGVT